MELNFSFKAVKEEVVEKYPNTPVLTYIGGNKTQKFQLNKKAAEILGYNITGQINYGLANGELLFLANTNGSVAENKSNIFAGKSFANAKFVDRLQKHFNATLVENQEFLLTEPETKQQFPLLLISNESPTTAIIDDFTDINDEDVAFQDPEETTEEQHVEIYESMQSGSF